MPDQPTLQERIAATLVFREVAAPILSRLIEESEVITLDAEAVLYRKGDAVDAVYLLLDGLLEVRAHKAPALTYVLERLTPGHVIGELRYLLGGVRCTNVEAVEASQPLRIPIPIFEATYRNSPPFRKHLQTMVLVRMNRDQVAESLGPALHTGNAALLQDRREPL